MSAPFLTPSQVPSRKASSHPPRKRIQCPESGSGHVWAGAPLRGQDWGESVGSEVSSGPLTHRRAPARSALLSLCPRSSSWSSLGPGGRVVPTRAAVCSRSLLCRPTRFCVPRGLHLPLPSCTFLKTVSVLAMSHFLGSIASMNVSRFVAFTSTSVMVRGRWEIKVWFQLATLNGKSHPNSNAVVCSLPRLLSGGLPGSAHDKEPAGQ